MKEGIEWSLDITKCMFHQHSSFLPLILYVNASTTQQFSRLHFIQVTNRTTWIRSLKPKNIYSKNSEFLR